MNCYYCKTPLIWGGDDDADVNSEYSIITNLTCPKCNSYVVVSKPKDAAVT